MSLPDLPPRDEWVATDAERVYYASDGDRFDRGEDTLAEFITDHIPGWDVVITMGPYRWDYDIAYQLHPDLKAVQIDCYSASFAPTTYGPGHAYRKQHPAVEWAESAIHEIAEGIKESGVGFD